MKESERIFKGKTLKLVHDGSDYVVPASVQARDGDIRQMTADIALASGCIDMAYTSSFATIWDDDDSLLEIIDFGANSGISASFDPKTAYVVAMLAGGTRIIIARVVTNEDPVLTMECDKYYLNHIEKLKVLTDIRELDLIAVGEGGRWNYCRLEDIGVEGAYVPFYYRLSKEKEEEHEHN